MEFVKFAALLIAGFGVAACSTPGAKFDAEKAKPIRTVAIVGFTSLNQVPDPFEGVGPATRMGVPTLNTFAKMTEHADRQLKNFGEALTKEMGWKVKPTEQVFAHEGYQGLYLDRMKNWKNTTTPDPAYQIHFAKNVLPVKESDLLTPDVRDHMMDNLKVDALVTVQITSSIIKPRLSVGNLGIGGQRTQSKVILKVYRKGMPDAVWLDAHAEGIESKEVLSLGWGRWEISMEPKLFSFYLKSAQDAQAALFDRRFAKDKKTDKKSE